MILKKISTHTSTAWKTIQLVHFNIVKACALEAQEKNKILCCMFYLDITESEPWDFKASLTLGTLLENC